MIEMKELQSKLAENLGLLDNEKFEMNGKKFFIKKNKLYEITADGHVKSTMSASQLAITPITFDSSSFALRKILDGFYQINESLSVYRTDEELVILDMETAVIYGTVLLFDDDLFVVAKLIPDYTDSDIVIPIKDLLKCNLYYNNWFYVKLFDLVDYSLQIEDINEEEEYVAFTGDDGNEYCIKDNQFYKFSSKTGNPKLSNMKINKLMKWFSD